MFFSIVYAAISVTFGVIYHLRDRPIAHGSVVGKCPTTNLGLCGFLCDLEQQQDHFFFTLFRLTQSCTGRERKASSATPSLPTSNFR